MKRRTDLYDLIRAMSKSEKRYFTIDAQKSGRTESRYLELFQAVNEMETVDEEVLRLKIGKHLSTDKNYLYESILRSMRDYRSTNSLAARIREMILDAKYLYERGLYAQCEERLENAKELADQLGDQTSLLEIIKEQRRIIRDTRKKGYEDFIKKKNEEQVTVINSLQAELYYLNIYEELVPIVVNNFELKKEKEKKLLEKNFQPLLSRFQEDEVEPNSIRRYYQCWALYYQLMGDFNQVFNFYGKVVDWWDEHPLNKEEEFNNYIVDISNYLHGYATKGQYQHFPKLLNNMENAKPKTLHDKSLVFQKISIYKLMYFINTGETQGIDDFLIKIEKGLSSYFISESSQFVLLFNTAFLLFIQEDFNACKKWCEKIFARKKVATRIDIQRAARLLYLISEYEIDEVDGPERALRSINRYLQAKNSEQDKSDFENLVLSTIQKLIFVPLREKKDIYQGFIQELENSSASKKIPLGLDELFSIWATSKLQKKHMSSLLHV